MYGRFSSNESNLLSERTWNDTFGNDTIINSHYIVTSIADAFDHSDDEHALTLREAIDLTNNSSSSSTWYRHHILLPAWLFRLTLEGESGIEAGSLDVNRSLSLWGISADKTEIDATGIRDQAFEDLGSNLREYDLSTYDG